MILHLSLDIRGALRWSNRELSEMFRREDGSYLDAAEAWSYLADELAKGRRVLPLSEDCDGFDYETGCPGHIVKPTEKT